MSEETPQPVAIAPGDPLPPWCDAAWNQLAARAAGGTLPHALLLAGPAGLGKRAFAEAFVRARLCEQPEDGHACGRCRACKLLDAGSHPDRIRQVTVEENPKTHKLRTEIVVDQVRALSARLALATEFGGWQVAVIDPADAMNPAAQNALLKTLEEPSAGSLIVLIADQPWRLIATIRSRCQRVEFTVPAHAEALAWLNARGIAHADAALAAAGGNPGQAWMLAEQGGMQRRQDVAHDLLALAAGRVEAREVGKAWAADEPSQRLEQAVRLIHGALRAHAMGQPSRLDLKYGDVDLVALAVDAVQLQLRLHGPLRADLALFEWLDRVSPR